MNEDLRPLEEIVPSEGAVVVPQLTPEEAIILLEQTIYDLMYSGDFIGPTAAQRVIAEEHQDLVRLIPRLCDENGEPRLMGLATISNYAQRHMDKMLAQPRRVLAERLWADQLRRHLAVQATVFDAVLEARPKPGQDDQEKRKVTQIKYVDQYTKVSALIADMLPGHKAPQRVELAPIETAVTDAEREKWRKMGRDLDKELEEYERSLLGTGDGHGNDTPEPEAETKEIAAG